MSDLTLEDLNWIALRSGPDWLTEKRWQNLIAAARAHLEGEVAPGLTVRARFEKRVYLPQPPQHSTELCGGTGSGDDDPAPSSTVEQEEWEAMNAVKPSPDAGLVERLRSRGLKSIDGDLLDAAAAAIEAKDAEIEHWRTREIADYKDKWSRAVRTAENFHAEMERQKGERSYLEDEVIPHLKAEIERLQKQVEFLRDDNEAFCGHACPRAEIERLRNFIGFIGSERDVGLYDLCAKELGEPTWHEREKARKAP
jgi:hypothetical protein